VLRSGRARARRPAEVHDVAWASLTRVSWFFRALYGSIMSASCFYCIEEWGPSSTGPHSLSTRDNSMPTVRITEHNGGNAAVIPVQGKQQEAVVIDSAVMKLLALRRTVTLPVAVTTWKRKEDCFSCPRDRVLVLSQLNLPTPFFLFFFSSFCPFISDLSDLPP